MASSAFNFFILLLLGYNGSSWPLGNTWKIYNLPGCQLTNDHLVGNKTILIQLTLQSSFVELSSDLSSKWLLLEISPLFGLPSLSYLFHLCAYHLLINPLLICSWRMNLRLVKLSDAKQGKLLLLKNKTSLCVSCLVLSDCLRHHGL